MYKDKEKQRAAVLKAVHKFRGVIPKPVIPCNTLSVIPKLEPIKTKEVFIGGARYEVPC